MPLVLAAVVAGKYEYRIVEHAGLLGCFDYPAEECVDSLERGVVFGHVKAVGMSGVVQLVVAYSHEIGFLFQYVPLGAFA